MTVSLFHRFEVKDFDLWLNPDPNVPKQNMKAQGVLAYSLHRNRDNPNQLMIYYLFPDEETLRSYITFVETLPGEMKNFFALPGTVEWWIGDYIETHSNS
jgi:quinol monooxygenase YgiN